MREPNPRLARARRRKAELLPQITRLRAEGRSTREIARIVGVPKSTILRWQQSLRREYATRSAAENMEMIDDLVAGYQAVYRRAMKSHDARWPTRKSAPCRTAPPTTAKTGAPSAPKPGRACPPTWATPGPRSIPSANSWAWTSPRRPKTTKTTKPANLPSTSTS